MQLPQLPCVGVLLLIAPSDTSRISDHMWHARFLSLVILSSAVFSLSAVSRLFSCCPVMRFRSFRLAFSSSRFNIKDVTDCASLGLSMHTTLRVSLFLSRWIVNFVPPFGCERTLVLIQRERVSLRSELRSTHEAPSCVLGQPPP